MDWVACAWLPKSCTLKHYLVMLTVGLLLSTLHFIPCLMVLTSGLTALYATCISFKHIFDDLQKLMICIVLQIKHLTMIGLLILLYREKRKSKVYLSNKWNQVMFTHWKHINILHNHHLIMVFIKYGIIEYIWNQERHIQCNYYLSFSF